MVVPQGDSTKQQEDHAEKVFQNYPAVLLKYNITFTELWNSILIN